MNAQQDHSAKCADKLINLLIQLGWIVTDDPERSAIANDLATTIRDSVEEPLRKQNAELLAALKDTRNFIESYFTEHSSPIPSAEPTDLDLDVGHLIYQSDAAIARTEGRAGT